MMTNIRGRSAIVGLAVLLSTGAAGVAPATAADSSAAGAGAGCTPVAVVSASPTSASLVSATSGATCDAGLYVTVTGTLFRNGVRVSGTRAAVFPTTQDQQVLNRMLVSNPAGNQTFTLVTQITVDDGSAVWSDTTSSTVVL